MCYNKILDCFHGGGVGENLLTIVLVRKKMTHTSSKHQPNWFKFARYSYCIISYPNVLSNLRFLVLMATGTNQILLGYENMWFCLHSLLGSTVFYDQVINWHYL